MAVPGFSAEASLAVHEQGSMDRSSGNTEANWARYCPPDYDDSAISILPASMEFGI